MFLYQKQHKHLIVLINDYNGFMQPINGVFINQHDHQHCHCCEMGYNCQQVYTLVNVVYYVFTQCMHCIPDCLCQMGNYFGINSLSFTFNVKVVLNYLATCKRINQSTMHQLHYIHYLLVLTYRFLMMTQLSIILYSWH